MSNESRPSLSLGSLSLVCLALASACGSSAATAPAPAGTGSGGAFTIPGTGATQNGCTASAEFSCGGAPATGGTNPGAGGTIPGGGGSSNGGSSSGGGGGDTGGGGLGAGVTITVCAGKSPPNIPPSSFDSCPAIAGCEVSRCVPLNALPPSVPADLLGKCGADGKSVCVPDEYIKTYGEFLTRSCKSIGDAEGRCISTCVPQVNGLMDALPKDVCGDAERCAPCINPNDGTETGACKQGCDTGMSDATKSKPLVFQTCETDGVCVPQSIVPKALLARLTILTGTGCTDTTTVCAPVKKTQNLKYNFVSCVPGSFAAIGAPNTDSSGTVTQWGGCVPGWLAGGEAAFLAQQTCATGEFCAPCHDPLTPDPNVPIALEAPTGACPVPLPTDPAGGLPPDGSGGVAGVTGQPPVVWGTPGTGAAPGTGGAGAGGSGTAGAGGGP